MSKHWTWRTEHLCVVLFWNGLHPFVHFTPSLYMNSYHYRHMWE